MLQDHRETVKAAFEMVEAALELGKVEPGEAHLGRMFAAAIAPGVEELALYDEARKAIGLDLGLVKWWFECEHTIESLQALALGYSGAIRMIGSVEDLEKRFNQNVCPLEFVAGVLANPQGCSGEFLARAVEISDDHLRYAIARHPNLTPDVAADIAFLGKPGLFEQLAKRPDCSLALMGEAIEMAASVVMDLGAEGGVCRSYLETLGLMAIKFARDYQEAQGLKDDAIDRRMAKHQTLRENLGLD